MHQRTVRTLLLAATAATGLAITSCGSNKPLTAATQTPAAVTTSASPTAPATAPAADECSAFAQAYNGTVSPVLKGTGATGNVYLTQMTDAFNTLAGTVSSAQDAYSQTIAKDASAVAADPTSLSALATFNGDLPQFLKACGMSGS